MLGEFDKGVMNSPRTDVGDDYGGARWGPALSAALVALAAAALLACGSADRPLPGRPRADDGASVVAERPVAGRIVDLTVRSPVLGTTGRVRLLTPRGWSSRREGDHWPVLFLLPGCCDTYDSWTRETQVEDVPQLRNVLVVMPEAGAVGFYSNWRGDGNGVRPAWETFHLRELRQILERGYGAGKRRAVAGLSMGGLGAMAYAARHPGLFRAAASYSGLLHPLEDAQFYLNLFSAHTDDPLAIWGDHSASILGGPRPNRTGREAARHSALRLLGQRRTRSVRPIGSTRGPRRGDRLSRGACICRAAAGPAYPRDNGLLRAWHARLAVLGARARALAAGGDGGARCHPVTGRGAPAGRHRTPPLATKPRAPPYVRQSAGFP